MTEVTARALAGTHIGKPVSFIAGVPSEAVRDVELVAVEHRDQELVRVNVRATDGQTLIRQLHPLQSVIVDDREERLQRVEAAVVTCATCVVAPVADTVRHAGVSLDRALGRPALGGRID